MTTIEEGSQKRDSKDMAKSMLQLSFNRRAGARVDGMGSTHASGKEFGAVTTPCFGALERCIRRRRLCTSLLVASLGDIRRRIEVTCEDAGHDSETTWLLSHERRVQFGGSLKMLYEIWSHVTASVLFLSEICIW